MENGAIIRSEAGDSYVQENPSVYEGGNAFSMHALQVVASAFSASGTRNTRFKIYSNLYKSNISEIPIPVYYLRLQFWGDHSDTWLDYYKSNYEFTDNNELVSNSLLYTPSTNEGGVWFALAYSIIRFSIR